MPWRTAYARQAKSDLAARDVLLRARSLPTCHQLHYLQMACEKLAEAHLIQRGTDPEKLQSSHAYVAKQLPIIARQILARDAGKRPKDARLLKKIRELARRIELLAPAVKGGGSVPANCEYPWRNPKGQIVAPADHTFGLNLLYEPAGTRLLKIVRRAIEDLLAQPK